MQFVLWDVKWGPAVLGSAGGQVPWSLDLVDLNHINPNEQWVFDRSITEPVFQQLIRDALNVWERIVNIDFVEAADPASARLRFGWDAIDGAGNTLADALPTAGGGQQGLFSIDRADLRFDTAEMWSPTKGQAPDGQSNFFITAVHEIGHAIGLLHSQPDEVMGAFENPLSPLALAAGDIAGGQAIYGPANRQDQTVDAMFVVNGAQAKGLAAAYETLLGGVPNAAGFVNLIQTNLQTNFGAGPGPVFNTENIFINVVNALYQGNDQARLAFDAIATGDSLSAKLGAVYQALVPAGSQSQAGQDAFAAQQAFYTARAAELGISGADGGAVVGFAALLNIVVRDDLAGIGDTVNDLYAAVVGAVSALPATGTTLTAMDQADGIAFDADDGQAIAFIADDTAGHTGRICCCIACAYQVEALTADSQAARNSALEYSDSDADVTAPIVSSIATAYIAAHDMAT